MPKKPLPKTDGITAGLIRKSRVIYPHWCVSDTQKEQYEEELVLTRKAELIADAARDNLLIDRWYIDMAVSGRPEFEDKRLGLAALRAEATSGGVRFIYTRDLSRIFRGVRRQEEFFEEMTRLGVEVRAADIPRVADPATQDLVRQNMGALHQFIARRQGLLLRQILRDKVELGQWVGTQHSVLGLTYNTSTKGFDADPATVDHARFVFETFNACGGIALRAAVCLNTALDASHPRAGHSSRGARWNSQRVLAVVRCPLYRQEARWGLGDAEPLVKAMPHKIPRVLEPELVAEAGRLLLLRETSLGDNLRKRKAGRLDYTYSPFLRCAHCGGRLRARRNPASHSRQQSEAVHFAWGCHAATSSQASRSHACDQSQSFQQWRLERLVGRGLRAALSDYAETYRLDSEQTPRRATAGRADTHPQQQANQQQAALERLESRRLRYLRMYAEEVIDDMTILQNFLLELDKEQEAVMQPAAPSERPPEPPALSAGEWHALTARFEHLWEGAGGNQAAHGAGGDEALNQSKHDLLRALGVVMIVRLLPGLPMTRTDGNVRRYAGPLEVRMELGLLGRTGLGALCVRETEDDLVDYYRWRARQRWRARADVQAQGLGDWETAPRRVRLERLLEAKWRAWIRNAGYYTSGVSDV